MGVRPPPRSSMASRPPLSASKCQRCRYARDAAARGMATHDRSAPSWYAMACRSAWAQLFIFASIAIRLPGRKPRRSARRPRIGTSIRTVNPARSSQAAMGWASSDSMRNDTRACMSIRGKNSLATPRGIPTADVCEDVLVVSSDLLSRGCVHVDERQFSPNGMLPDLIPLPDEDELQVPVVLRPVHFREHERAFERRGRQAELFFQDPLGGGLGRLPDHQVRGGEHPSLAACLCPLRIQRSHVVPRG